MKPTRITRIHRDLSPDAMIEIANKINREMDRKEARSKIRELTSDTAEDDPKSRE
jgi:hypothetical protein